MICNKIMKISLRNNADGKKQQHDHTQTFSYDIIPFQ
jgi:hypothetical protein